MGASSARLDMIRKQGRVSMLRDMILFLKEMFIGRKVKLGDFPEAHSAFLAGSSRAGLEPAFSVEAGRHFSLLPTDHRHLRSPVSLAMV